LSVPSHLQDSREDVVGGAAVFGVVRETGAHALLLLSARYQTHGIGLDALVDPEPAVYERRQQPPALVLADHHVEEVAAEVAVQVQAHVAASMKEDHLMR
jgi:hypothetical protein